MILDFCLIDVNRVYLISYRKDKGIWYQAMENLIVNMSLYLGLCYRNITSNFGDASLVFLCFKKYMIKH